MAQLRIRPNGRIQFDLHLYGQRFREGTSMMATPKNIQNAKIQLKQINAEIDLGTFQYRDHFPNSKKVEKFEMLQRNKYPDRTYPFFDDFADEWFDRQKMKWKSSYQHTVKRNLEAYLKPTFGNTLINEVTLANVEFYRQALTELTKEDGSRKLSNRRINNIFWPLVAILGLAGDEYKFDYPLRRYKVLKEESADSHPMTANEVQRFLAVVSQEWRDYFIVRFWTGMRSCEVHGLYTKHIDFAHRLIHIRQNYVNGEIGDVKTPKSRRSLKMCDTLYQALTRIMENKSDDSPFVFTQPNGKPLNTHYVSKKLWYPTLKKAGLSPRRPYETRHTAAVLHIAAHENPLYVSQMLGHSNARLLFDVYAPYVANASGLDGNAFSEMMMQQTKGH